MSALHGAVFPSFAHAILAVDCWTREAARDGRALHHLVAVIDGQDANAVRATLAPRRSCLATSANVAAAIETVGKDADVIEVVAFTSMNEIRVTPLTRLVQWANEAFRKEI